MLGLVGLGVRVGGTCLSVTLVLLAFFLVKAAKANDQTHL